MSDYENCPSICVTEVEDPVTHEITYTYDQGCLLLCIYGKLVDLKTSIDGVNSTCASILALLNRAFVAPHASGLISEYMSSEDLDGNGLIYGTDFYITQSTMPPMLKNMMIPKRGFSMTWEDYLASVA